MISFGKSSSEGKSASFSNPVRLDLYSPEQKELFEQLAGTVRGGLARSVPIYPRELYTPRTPEEQDYFDVAGQIPGEMQGRSDALNQVLSGKPAYDINPEISKQYFESSIRPGMMREYEDVTKPAIAEEFAGPGYWGSSRALAQTDAAQKLAEQLSGTEASLTYADEAARRASLESAATRQAQSALPAVEAGISDIGTAGQYARMIEQEKKMADMQRWLMGETVDGVSPTQYNPFLQLAFQYMGLQPYTYGTQSGSKSNTKGSSWNSAILWG